MNESDATVLVVDDDAPMREALAALFRSVGLQTKLYDSAAAVLERPFPDAACCLVLDVRLPGIGGLDFQEQLVRAGRDVPVVFITGHGDIPMSVRAMKAGAVDFLPKPFRDQDMLDAVAAALARDRERRAELARMEDWRTRRASLTTREREVMDHVTEGLLNKQIAGLLGLSEITVKMHRGSMMKKMGARSVAQLVKIAEALNEGGAP